VYKNKRVLMEAVHKEKAEKLREKTLADQYEARRTKNKATRERKATRREERLSQVRARPPCLCVCVCVCACLLVLLACGGVHGACGACPLPVRASLSSLGCGEPKVQVLAPAVLSSAPTCPAHRPCPLHTSPHAQGILPEAPKAAAAKPAAAPKATAAPKAAPKK